MRGFVGRPSGLEPLTPEPQNGAETPRPGRPERDRKGVQTAPRRQIVTAVGGGAECLGLPSDGMGPSSRVLSLCSGPVSSCAARSWPTSEETAGIGPRLAAFSTTKLLILRCSL